MDEMQMIRKLYGDAVLPAPEVARRAKAGMFSQPAAFTPTRLRPAVHRRRAVGYAITAGLTAVAAAAALVIGSAGAPAPRDSHPNALRSARAVLLTAAGHVASAPTTGRYWRVVTLTTRLLPGGTQAHPYNLLLKIRDSQWLASDPRQLDWNFNTELGAKPLTKADLTAWRAAGSPKIWRFGLSTSPFEFLHYGPTPQVVTWQRGRGTVGSIEGPGMTAAQFRAIPSAVPALLSYLQRLAKRLQHLAPNSQNRSATSQLLWAEAIDLLQDPVSAQVRASTFRILADLPGVRLAGRVRDPLGRLTYELISGPRELRGDVIFVDPLRGQLADTEYRWQMGGGPGLFWARCRIGNRTVTEGLSGNFGRDSYFLRNFKRHCTVLVPPRWGRPYNGGLTYLQAFVTAGWTDDSPPIPQPAKTGHN